MWNRFPDPASTTCANFVLFAVLFHSMLLLFWFTLWSALGETGMPIHWTLLLQYPHCAVYSQRCCSAYRANLWILLAVFQSSQVSFRTLFIGSPFSSVCSLKSFHSCAIALPGWPRPTWGHFEHWFPPYLQGLLCGPLLPGSWFTHVCVLLRPTLGAVPELVHRLVTLSRV